jgi:HAD superfamily phosphoserine phosphatase-like hydrolase
VRPASIEDVTTRIEGFARDEKGGVLAFDGDGTLWSGDIGEDFFEALLASGRIEAVAHEAMAREAEAEKLDATGSAVDVARRIHAAYLAGRFPEERVCEIMTWAFAGWPKEEMEAFAARTIEALDLRRRLHGEAVKVARWAAEKSIDVFLVSASPRAIVEAAAHLVGIDTARVTAATEIVDDAGIVTTGAHRPIPYGPGKVARLREKLGARTLYAAFGDNAFDVPLLQHARVPVAIRPKPRLVERAGEVPGLAVLERV